MQTVPAGTSRRKHKRRHPGVTIIPPDPERRIGWRARWRDPDTGKLKKETLSHLLRTKEAREYWAARKAKAIAKRKLELSEGATRATGTRLADAVDRYFEDHKQLRASTLEVYRVGANKLVRWAADNGLRRADDLTVASLTAFRVDLIKEPKVNPKAGGRRGEKQATDSTRSPHTVNRDIRSVKAVLSYLRKLGLVARLSSDDLRDGLGRVKANKEAPDYLKSDEIRQLLAAALKHDGETFRATRAEHAGQGRPGTTARYQPMAPLLAVALLTGMRISEAVELTWERVDLEALGDDGNVCGEINLEADDLKTGEARRVDLSVSPALRELLKVLRHNSGGEGRVCGLTRHAANSGARRLVRKYGAPYPLAWHRLRRTCGCYLANAPGIFGAASVWRAARQIGHSVAIAERHYLGVIRGIPREARDLETAMNINDLMGQIIEAAKARKA